MKLQANTNFPDVARQINQLGTKVYRQAIYSAMNKTVAKARTVMSREIRQEFAISAARVNAALRVQRAISDAGAARIEAAIESPTKRGRSLNLIHFTARQTKAGVSVKVKRSGPRKTIPGAFIANKGRTVFVREGKTRLPIKSVQTINVAQMFNTQRIRNKVTQLMHDDFPEQFARAARWYSTKP